MQPETTPNVRWGEWISEGWQMFAERWQVWVPQVLILFLTFAIPIAPIYLLAITAQLNAQQAGQPPEPPAWFLPAIFILMPLLFLAIAFFWGGLWRTAFKQMRGEPISVGDLFSGADLMPRIIGALLAITFLYLLGAIFCIFPGLVIYAMLHFTIPLIVEKDMSISSALSTSFDATKGHWFMFTLFFIVVAIISSLGQIACYIGMVASYPLLFTITAVAYRDIFGVPGARSFAKTSQSTPTSYVGQSYSSPGASPPSVTSQPIPQPQKSILICPQCGASISSEAKFCNYCGNRLVPSSD